MNSCAHKNVNVISTPGTIHHAKEVCRDCGQFLRWQPKPVNLAKQLEDQRRLQKLELVPVLTDWEKGFVLSLQKQGRHFSPKQHEWLDKLSVKYGV